MNNLSPKDIAEAAITYFEASNNLGNNKSLLSDEARSNVKQFGDKVMTPYNENKLAPHLTDAIRTGETLYRDEHPIETKVEQSQELERTEPMPLVLTRTKDEEYLPKAGFINVAILLYGMLNVGIIVAIALMK